jgi:hypothetical protein
MKENKENKENKKIVCCFDSLDESLSSKENKKKGLGYLKRYQ